MKKAEIRAKVQELLSSGVAKSDVFKQLSNQGVKDSRLAYFIAAYPDPIRCEKHSGKVDILITIMFIQAAIGFFIGFAIAAKMSPNARWAISIFIALIPILFAWGFYTNRVAAYNAYILLSIVQLPKSFGGFSSAPVASSMGIAIGIGWIAYVWYVREKIFPDFMFTMPKKIKGQYVFAG